jgi:hypothetical protein
MTAHCRQSVTALVAIVLAAPPLAAQSGAPDPNSSHKVEAIGILGAARMSHGDDRWGGGADWGIAAAVRPFSSWADRLGFELSWMRLDDSGSPGPQVSQRLSANVVAADVAYHFGSHHTVQPYLFGGLGRIRAGYTYRCVDCVFRSDPVTGALVSTGVEESRNQGSKVGFRIGGGANVIIQRHLLIRPRLLITDTTPGSGYNWSWAQADIGLGVVF